MKVVVSAELVTKISKAGNDYKVLEITFENGYKKTVFLDSAELFVVEQLVK